MAGTKTTSDTLTSIFGILLHHPEWQKNLQNDLDNIIGRGNLPTLEHINQLPRVDAFIAEVNLFPK